MSLDATARESNIRDSIKKYFVDNLKRSSGVDILFDKSLASPNIANRNSVTRWVSINFNTILREKLSTLMLDLYCCTREDSEGFKLAQLTDLVLGLLTDSSQTDNFKRIPLYQSHPTNEWVVLGSFVVTDFVESQQFEYDDLTKYKVITVTLKWSAKI